MQRSIILHIMIDSHGTYTRINDITILIARDIEHNGPP